MAVEIVTDPEVRIGEPRALFSHKKYRQAQGSFHTTDDRFIFATNADEHDLLADQIVYIRDWRLLLNDASGIP